MKIKYSWEINKLTMRNLIQNWKKTRDKNFTNVPLFTKIEAGLPDSTTQNSPTLFLSYKCIEFLQNLHKLHKFLIILSHKSKKRAEFVKNRGVEKTHKNGKILKIPYNIFKIFNNFERHSKFYPKKNFWEKK